MKQKYIISLNMDTSGHIKWYRDKKKEREVMFNLSPCVWQIIEYVSVNRMEKKISLEEINKWLREIIKLGQMRPDYSSKFDTINSASCIYLEYLYKFLLKNNRWPNAKENDDLWLDV